MNGVVIGGFWEIQVWTHNVMVFQNSKNERSFLCDINEDWNTETQRYYGKKLGTYEYVLFLDSIHNARANLLRNIQNVATHQTPK